MAWLHKSQSIPPFPGGDSLGGNGPVGGGAFVDWLGTVGAATALYPEPDFPVAADVGFTKNELVYACIMEKATSLPDAPFRVFSPDGQGEPRDNHPLRQLLAAPNPSTTEFELIELTSIYMDLAGVGFWEIVRDRLDRPVELWPLRPDKVRIWPQANGRTQYGYLLGGGRVVPLGEDVLAFRYPNPMNPALGQAPMRGANRAVALDNEATDFVKALLQNRAVPGTVIETEQKIDNDLTDRLTAKWIERFGGQNRGQPAFLQKGMKVHSLGLDLGQLEFPDLRTISESRICMAFGVPPILVGAKVGLDRSTFANYSEARRSFWEETLVPLQKRMQQVIVARLLPMVEGPRPRRSIARFDNSEVIALRETEANRWDKGTQALRAGGITVNAFLRYVGLPADPGGDVYLRPAGVIPTDVEGNVVSTNPPAPALPPPPDPGTDTGTGADTTAGTGKASPAKALPTNGHLEQASFAEASVRVMRRGVASVVARQRAEVMPVVEAARSLLLIDPAAWDSTREGLWDDHRWNITLMTTVEPHMRQVAFAAARQVDTTAPVDLLKGYVGAAAANTAERWNTATAAALDAALVVGGPDVVDNAEKVFAAAAGRRADELARSLVTEMSGFAKVDTAKRLGGRSKTWRVTSDNPRPEHAALSGETVPAGAKFSNGDDWPRGNSCSCDVLISEGK